MWSTLTSSPGAHLDVSWGLEASGKHLPRARKLQGAGREHEKAFTGALGYGYKAG